MFLIVEERQISYHYPEDGFSYHGLHVELRNGLYFIYLENGYYFSDSSKIKRLLPGKYTVFCENNYYPVDFYFYDNEDGFNEYYLWHKKDIVVSSFENSHIVSKDDNMTDSYVSVIGGCIKSNIPVYVNGLRYRESQEININDRISIHGINIYVFTNFYYINSFKLNCNLESYSPERKIIQYLNKKEPAFVHLNQSVKEYELEKIKNYEPIKLHKRELSTIWPNLIMVVSLSCIAAISFYNSYLNDQPVLTRIAFVIMPISMCITSFLIPLSSYLINNYKNNKKEKEHINSYLSYIKQYEDSSLSEIENYLDKCNSYYFSLLNCNDKLFSQRRNDDFFLNLSLGKTTLSYKLEYQNSGVETINKKLEQLSTKLNSIDGFPLMFDVKKYHIISVVSQKEDKEYFFRRFLFELAYKHHFDDVQLIIYAKDLSICNDFYNLPHLFYGNERLTFNNEKQLEKINSIATDKSVVALMYDQCNCNNFREDIHCLYFSDDIKTIPKNNEVVIEYRNTGARLYCKDRIKFTHQKESVDLKNYYSYLGKLKSFVALERGKSFNDVFDLNGLDEYYREHDNRLKAYFGYERNEIMYLDLHEKGHGPHGLIGGSTGSGKSELIVSLLLSLCINYPPDYLNIVLIDYKGGGLSDSLSINGERLPHIIASVNNLDEDGLKRLIVILNLECKRRQKLFMELSRESGSSVMNIDDYLKVISDEIDFEKLAHLLIVVDEFAELKKNNPQEIKELISISRIGRSLGIHLILATQKPAGVIDDEIWSNSRFKIALKMYDERDSVDIIKRPDAAYLNTPGSFLLQIDDNLTRYNSIYSKNDISDYDPYVVTKFDNTLKKVKEIKRTINGNKSQCEAYCERIIELSRTNMYRVNNINFLPPEHMNRANIKTEYSFVMGICDDYLNNRREVVSYELSENILIFSSRKKEINSFLNTLNEYNRQTIVIAGHLYQNSSISDCLLYHESEDILFILDLLLNNDYDVCLVIEDLYSFLSYDDRYADVLTKLIKQSGNKKINLLCFTSSSSVSFRIVNCFKNKILIQISDLSCVTDFYYSKSSYKSRSYFYDGEPLPLVEIEEEDFVYEDKKTKGILKKIPDKIVPQTIENYNLIGYSLTNRKKIFSKGNIIIVSIYEELLKPYRAYTDVVINMFDERMAVNNNEDILWVGPGLFKQHLFITDLRSDLKTNEGVYIHSGTFQKVRVVNNE